MTNLLESLSANSYPGRGIVLGRSEDGKSAVVAYFIMGRSENSRNRVFVPTDDGIETKAFDESKMKDPSLIIYHPVRIHGSCVVVTNGDQTDTVVDFLKNGGSFKDALCTREFEPDAPNFTPRISGIINFTDGDFSAELSILKSDGDSGRACVRSFVYYDKIFAGEGRIIHTYEGDGSPIPSFVGEPRCVSVAGDIDSFTNGLWNSLNDDNKVSLYVGFFPLDGSKPAVRIINKNV